MQPDRFEAITSRYSTLRLAVVGDFCLDRYLEIDTGLNEVSIETGLPVYNVTKVRSQPGAAGTILNNLVALGARELYPVGFCGEDGEGYELLRGLASMRAVRLDHFFQSSQRRTFTYCKPLLMHPGKPPEELNRLDSKNWTPTPPALQEKLATAISQAARHADGMVVMDQVDIADTGVVAEGVLKQLDATSREHPNLHILADSRRGLAGFPPLIYKMNAHELATLTNTPPTADVEVIFDVARGLARKQGRLVFVTLAERGIVGAAPSGEVAHVPSLPIRGPIDIVGAGDAVMANLTAALASGATLLEAISLASLAASVVIHQLGTTGTASVRQLAELRTMLVTA